MKKTLIALAAVAATGAAMAQSSVTIDGIVDLGAVKPINQKGVRLDAGNGASQIRFRGTEDLGGGLKANFTVAMRFSPESGGLDGNANGRPLMQGESTVGLSGGFGSVKLGRALTAFQMGVNTTDPWATLTQATVAVLPGSYATDPVANADSAGLGRTDAITYMSPNFGGFTANASFGFKNSNAQANNGAVKQAENLVSLWLGYAAGPLYIGGGYEQNRSDHDVTALLATYDFGVVKIGGGFSNIDVVARKESAWNLMATVPLGAATLKFGYGKAKVKNGADFQKKLGMGVDYALSKRTTLYANYGRNNIVTNNVSKTGYDIGIKHAF